MLLEIDAQWQDNSYSLHTVGLTKMCQFLKFSDCLKL